MVLTGKRKKRILPQLRRAENSIVTFGQVNAVIGNSDYLQQLRVKLHIGDIAAKRLLYQVLLCFALRCVLFFFSLFDFFHQVTLTVTVQPGPVTVLTKLHSNVVFVELVPRVNKKPRKTTADDSDDEQYGC